MFRARIRITDSSAHSLIWASSFSVGRVAKSSLLIPLSSLWRAARRLSITAISCLVISSCGRKLPKSSPATILRRLPHVTCGANQSSGDTSAKLALVRLRFSPLMEARSVTNSARVMDSFGRNTKWPVGRS